ncbi:MAG TPA: Rieske 2Fe-2S domain-containing protein [Gemmatimonadaceae bacterium]|nr:Rieske 2Fe-2S domain-containing protein [Gemmatimonadaceae bacterium]
MSTHDELNETTPGDQCEGHGCGLPHTRRQFLRDSFLSMAGALVAVGVSRRTALAMPLEFTEARRASGATRSYTLPAADGAQIDKDNEVILVRWQNAVYAFALSCPHQNTALKWDDREHGFQCPKHHSAFKPDGEYIPGSGRATRSMDRFGISAAGSTGVVVDLDKLYQEDDDAAQWANAVVHLK